MSKNTSLVSVEQPEGGEPRQVGPEKIKAKEYQGQRVLTFADIDRLHGRPTGTASRAFRENRGRFVVNRDYFEVSQVDEKRRLTGNRASGSALIVMAQRGYLKTVRTFNDPLALDVYEEVLDVYFVAIAAAPPKALPGAEERAARLKVLVEREARLGAKQKALGYKKLAALSAVLKTSAEMIGSFQVHEACVLSGEDPNQHLPALPGAGKWLSPTQIAKRLGIKLAHVGPIITRAGNVRGNPAYSRTVLTQAKGVEKGVPVLIYNEAGVALITKQFRAESGQPMSLFDPA